MVSAVDQHLDAVNNQADLNHAVEMTVLQQESQDLFKKPNGLPPDRGIEHVILLLLNHRRPFNACTGCHYSSFKIQAQCHRIAGKGSHWRFDFQFWASCTVCGEQGRCPVHGLWLHSAKQIDDQKTDIRSRALISCMVQSLSLVWVLLQGVITYHEGRRTGQTQLSGHLFAITNSRCCHVGGQLHQPLFWQWWTGCSTHQSWLLLVLVTLTLTYPTTQLYSLVTHV